MSFQPVSYDSSLEKSYQTLCQQAKALFSDENDQTANLANASALLNQFLSNVNWVGFYIWKETENELVLGPFQGLPACNRITPGKGVCGTAYQKKQTVRVEDVHAFPGHIACDAASQSEIVVPLFTPEGEVYGVLDIDSPVLNRFSEQEESFLRQFADEIEHGLFSIKS